MVLVEKVGKQFRRSWVFRDLNFRIKRGESVVLIGPSGSGKSTLLKLIAGITPLTEGKIHCDTSELGMVFQKNALFDSISVEENLLFPLRIRKGIVGGLAKKKSEELLEAVGLTGTQRLFPSELSGGMQKRLGIARALIVEPELLLYDEPTAGLDPVTSRMISELILKMRKDNGTTLLTVASDMQRAYQMGDRIFLLAQGKLSGGEPPEKIQNTKDPAIRQFILGLIQGPLTLDGTWT